MAKTIYTERDIDDMARRGITTLAVDDSVVLTDLAQELARKLGIHLVREAAPPPADDGKDELIERVKSLVIGRLGGDVNLVQLDRVVRRIVNEMS